MRTAALATALALACGGGGVGTIRCIDGATGCGRDGCADSTVVSPATPRRS